MAGGSSKREAAARKAAAMTWGGVAAGLTLLSFVVQYLTGGSIVSWGNLLLLASYGGALFVIITTAQPTDSKQGKTQSAFDAALAEGGGNKPGGGEMFKDLFYVTAATQVLTLLTSYGWYLYLVVPVFAVYKGGTFAYEKYRMFKALATMGPAALAGGADEDADAAAAGAGAGNESAKDKAALKKERQQARQAAIRKGR